MLFSIGCQLLLQLLHELVPQAAIICVLLNPNYLLAENQLRDVQDAARAIGAQSLSSI